MVVNIPMFYLWGWESERSDGVPAIGMAAITGRARSTRTPVFDSTITSVVFNPEWVVPDSIARSEILPAIAANPDYLAQHHMEMSETGGTSRIRQLPGPWNALGRIKFVLPNVHGVYLHDTPATALFSRERRDFSHGCVRVADLSQLALWVLQEREMIGRPDRIRAAAADGMHAGRQGEPPAAGRAVLYDRGVRSRGWHCQIRGRCLWARCAAGRAAASAHRRRRAMKQRRTRPHRRLRLLFGPVSAGAQTENARPFAWDVARAVLIDPTTYAPALIVNEAMRQDWKTSQVLFAHGWVEQNRDFTLSGLANDVPVPYHEGTRRIRRAGAHGPGVSVVNNLGMPAWSACLSRATPNARR